MKSIGIVEFQVDVSMLGHTSWTLLESYAEWMRERLKEEEKEEENAEPQ